MKKLGLIGGIGTNPQFHTIKKSSLAYKKNQEESNFLN